MKETLRLLGYLTLENCRRLLRPMPAGMLIVGLLFVEWALYKAWMSQRGAEQALSRIAPATFSLPTSMSSRYIATMVIVPVITVIIVVLILTTSEFIKSRKTTERAS